MFNLSRLINELLCGKRLIKTGATWAPIIFCEGLSGKEKVLGELQYEEAFIEAVSEGIPTDEELKKNLFLGGVWSHNQDRILEECEKNIKFYKKQLIGLKYKIARKKATRRRLTKIEKRRNSLLSYKMSLFCNSAERCAREQQIWWSIYKMATHTDGSPLWPDFESFSNFDADEVVKIINAYLTGFILSFQDIRKIARSGSWRIYYTTCKNSSDLFGRKLCDLDDNQFNLLYWSVVYDNAINSYESPADDVLEDDELFDSWLDTQSRKRKSEAAKSRIDKGSGGGGPNSMHETFVMTDEEGSKLLYEEIG
jgi:hypothetical protein